MAALHQLIVAHLTAQRQTHLVLGRRHKEVAIDCTYHFMARARTAGRHADWRLDGYNFLTAQTGLHHDVWIGQVHLHNAHLEGQCRHIELCRRHARSHQMWEDERVHVIGLAIQHPLIARSARKHPCDQQEKDYKTVFPIHLFLQETVKN